MERLRLADEPLISQIDECRHPYPRGGNADHGMEAEITDRHGNKATDRGCVSRLVSPCLGAGLLVRAYASGDVDCDELPVVRYLR